ncbi:hypothetical protein AAEX28_10700 [Lentisphaerota bacterium WC36G]|nr:hypothetical protein LJT99_13545 [Lentisphaerae bacterium WC36]
MKYFFILIISFLIYNTNAEEPESEFKRIGYFTVSEFVTEKYSIKHTINFARTSGLQYCFLIKDNNHVFTNNSASYSDPNVYTSVVVNIKQIYQLYHAAVRAKYIQRQLLIRFKKYLYYTYGDNDGGTLGLAIKPSKLRTVVLLILNGQEYQFATSDFTHFMKVIKPVAEKYGPISGIYQSPAWGYLK